MLLRIDALQLKLGVKIVPAPVDLHLLIFWISSTIKARIYLLIVDPKIYVLI